METAEKMVMSIILTSQNKKKVIFGFSDLKFISSVAQDDSGYSL